MYATRIVIQAAKAFYEEVLFFIMTGAILLVSTLLLVPLPFALVGLYMVAHRAVRGQGVKWSLYWQAIKQYGGKSVLLTLIILLGYVLLASNIWFYATPDVSPLPTNIAIWIVMIWVVGAVIWTGMTFYSERS